MYIGALDIGGTKTIAAVVNEKGLIAKKVQFRTTETDCERHLDYCAGILHNVLEELSIKDEDLAGIGVTLPGITDSLHGILIRAPYENWEMVQVGSILSKKFSGIPVFCENDVNACAVGEQYFGLGKKYDNYIWMTVSTGVGGAVVNDGKLVRGTDGYAGELGHLKVEYENPAVCPCGQSGCLEAQGSGTAINRMVREKVKEDAGFAAAIEKISINADAASCAELARQGNQTAVSIFEKAGEYLGRGISYCVNILNPQAVIIGGGVAASLDLILPGIKTAVSSCAFDAMQDVEIVETPLGYEAALLGAAALVLQNGKAEKYAD